MNRPPETPPAGWHPDPWRRFELRYFNGSSWTADVSTQGVRAVDTVAPRATSTTPTNTCAAAGFAVVAVAVLVGLIPYLFILALPATIVGAVLAWRGRTTAHELGGRGRALSVWTLAMVPLAVAASVAGIVFTKQVERDVRRVRSIDPSAVTLTRCDLAGGNAVVQGRLDNGLLQTGDFAVFIRLTAASGTTEVIRHQLDDVHSRGSASFTIERPSVATQLQCAVVAVTSRS